MLPAPSDVVDQRYRVLRQIGSGAHGVVYKVRDLESRQELALKFLDEKLTTKADYVERLRREAAALARLSGTAAVRVHALNTTPAGTYLVMEYLKGKDLQQLLRSGEEKGGTMRPDYLVRMLRPIAATLTIAHSQAIVHRDLKPSNIFVLDRSVGRGIRLLDFGLVKLLDAAAITKQGDVAGTPSYMAPECWHGNSLELDHRIDVYALGVVLFRALAGRVPHKSDGLVAQLRWATQGERPSLYELRPDLPKSIDVWVQKALAIEPSDRYQSIEQLWSALEVCLGTASGLPF